MQTCPGSYKGIHFFFEDKVTILMPSLFELFFMKLVEQTAINTPNKIKLPHKHIILPNNSSTNFTENNLNNLSIKTYIYMPMVNSQPYTYVHTYMHIHTWTHTYSYVDHVMHIDIYMHTHKSNSRYYHTKGSSCRNDIKSIKTQAVISDKNEHWLKH